MPPPTTAKNADSAIDDLTRMRRENPPAHQVLHVDFEMSPKGDWTSEWIAFLKEKKRYFLGISGTFMLDGDPTVTEFTHHLTQQKVVRYEIQTKHWPWTKGELKELGERVKSQGWMKAVVHDMTPPPRLVMEKPVTHPDIGWDFHPRTWRVSGSE